MTTGMAIGTAVLFFIVLLFRVQFKMAEYKGESKRIIVSHKGIEMLMDDYLQMQKSYISIQFIYLNHDWHGMQVRIPARKIWRMACARESFGSRKYVGIMELDLFFAELGFETHYFGKPVDAAIRKFVDKSIMLLFSDVRDVPEVIKEEMKVGKEEVAAAVNAGAKKEAAAVKTGAKAELKSEVKAEVEAQAKTEAKAQAKAEAKAQAKAEAEAEAGRKEIARRDAERRAKEDEAANNIVWVDITDGKSSVPAVPIEKVHMRFRDIKGSYDKLYGDKFPYTNGTSIILSETEVHWHFGSLKYSYLTHYGVEGDNYCGQKDEMIYTSYRISEYGKIRSRSSWSVCTEYGTDGCRLVETKSANYFNFFRKLQ